MFAIHDQAIILDDAISNAQINTLLSYVENLEDFIKAKQSLESNEVYYQFHQLSYNSKPYDGLNKDIISVVNECHKILFEIINAKLTFPSLVEEYSGISVATNYSMGYHADAERPYCKDDRNLGIPNDTDHSGFIAPSKNEWQPNHSPKRIYTSLVYLTDNFIGGETTLPIKNLNIKPKSGRMFGFPCSRDYIHGVRKNIGGIRIAFISWYMLSDKNNNDPYGKNSMPCSI